jgi:hypothetical protein
MSSLPPNMAATLPAIASGSARTYASDGDGDGELLGSPLLQTPVQGSLVPGARVHRGAEARQFLHDGAPDSFAATGDESCGAGKAPPPDLRPAACGHIGVPPVCASDLCVSETACSCSTGSSTSKGVKH